MLSREAQNRQSKSLSKQSRPQQCFSLLAYVHAISQIEVQNACAQTERASERGSERERASERQRDK
jgi:hypothetical protein